MLVLCCVKLAELELHFLYLFSIKTNMEVSRLELTVNRILICIERWQSNRTHVYPGKETVSLGAIMAHIYCR